MRWSMYEETACEMPTYDSDQDVSLMLPPVCNPAEAVLAVRIILQTHHGHPE